MIPVQILSGAQQNWPHRVPNIRSADLSERLGDCIYDYSNGKAIQRPSVHGPGNVTTDLGGQNALVSSDFYYFGNRAIPLPNYLLPICHQTQGHRSDSNAPYLDQFVSWLLSLNFVPGQMYGWPDFIVDWGTVSSCGGCIIRKIDDENDNPC